MDNMDNISEVRLQLIYPRLADKVRQMASILEGEGEGIVIRVVQGMRTFAEQEQLYAQGRTAPGKIVTNCRGGFSYHNYGLAVDLVPSQFAPDEPYSPDWNASHPSWKRMESLGQSLGLDSGAAWRTFVDAPHFQLTGSYPEGEPSEELRDMLLSDRGIERVWDAVTQSLEQSEVI